MINFQAFAEFGSDNDMLPIEPDEECDPEEITFGDDDYCVDDFDDGSDDADLVEIREINEVFEGIEDELSQYITLPKHRRCASHTFNLVATADLKNIPGWSHKNSFKKTLDKAQNLWRKQNMSSSVSLRIREELGHKLPYPTKIRWNSLFDSMEVLNKIFIDEDKTKMRRLQNIMETTPGLQPFTPIEFDLIKEYCEVMTPVAMALDVLRGEEYAYTGGLLPTIYSVQSILRSLKTRTDKPIKYTKAVIIKLLDALDNRFGHLFEEEDLILGTAFSPVFKLWHIQLIQPNKVTAIKEKLVQVLKGFVDKNIESPGSSTGGEEDEKENEPKKPHLWRDLLASKKEKKVQEKSCNNAAEGSGCLV